jgi:murein L,D-transpeptidase YafK
VTINKMRGKKIALMASGLVLAGLGIWSLWPASALPADTKAGLVVVHKATRRLDLYRNGALLKSYSVSLGRHPEGPKRQEGDGRTPEGKYVLDYRNANSSFYRALHISYPDSADQSRRPDTGRRPRWPCHGARNEERLGRLHLAVDWTDGCVAVTDREMDEIWRAVPDGTRITLKP